MSVNRWLIPGLIVVGMACWLSLRPAAKPPSPPLSYWIEPALATGTLTAQIQTQLKTAGYKAHAAASQAGANLTLSASATAGAQPILYSEVGRPAALINAQIVTPTSQPTAYLTAPAAIKTKLAAALHATPGNPWTLTAIGDIIIGRTVYLQMQRYHDMQRPFAQFADSLKASDLTLADLECTISDAHTLVTDGGMTFASPAAAAAGLTTAGIDAVNVANNHSYNVGAAGFLDTLDAMKAQGIPTFGGGHNDTEAHKPLILTTHGVKIALLGYSSIVGSTPAGPLTPGLAHLSMAPWSPFDETEATRMEQDIRTAKTQADVVMVYYHWGTEYTHDANTDQRTIAHRAIDAGADLILGTHPHWVQGIEWYHDRLIAYSLGNFIFDQEWSLKTKQGTFLQTTFNGKTLVKANFVPYQIEDYLQPRPISTSVGQQILSDIYSHSWWPTR